MLSFPSCYRWRNRDTERSESLSKVIQIRSRLPTTRVCIHTSLGEMKQRLFSYLFIVQHLQILQLRYGTQKSACLTGSQWMLTLLAKGLCLRTTLSYTMLTSTEHIVQGYLEPKQEWPGGWHNLLPTFHSLILAGYPYHKEAILLVPASDTIS